MSAALGSLENGRVEPPFFDEGNEQGAGFLKCAEPLRLARGGVGMALHGGIGGDDEDVACFGRSARAAAPGSITPSTGTEGAAP